ncbi:MAG: DNA primase [Actinobacteria bacterium]|nr:DNA primase [Actinomycetota bacterium]
MSRNLKDGEVEELKARADIHSIISSYVNLKKTGKNYTGLCPFHKEKTPSFTVDPAKQLFHCFGCGEGGDVISFIMKIENMEFIEAVEFLAKKVGYDLKYVYSGSKDYLEFTKVKTRLFELTELAKKYYNYLLFNTKKGSLALDYLSGRGFNREILEQFEVGYSLNSWRGFSDFAKRRGFTSKELLECGLAIESRRGEDEVYDRFRGRVMFPIKDVSGNTIGFGGRIIPGVEKVMRESAKYINSPETRIYSKSRSLYGIFEAKNQIVKEDRVLIVEGYTDVIALHQHGIKNVVASLGTALTLEQIGILGRFTRNVVLVFDSDEAGINASLRGMERLMEYNQKLDLYQENNIDISVAILEEGYDPSDFVLKRGKDDFLKRVENPINIIDFTMDMILSTYDISTLNGKLRASDKLLDFIATISSKIIQEECVKKVSQRLDLRESLLFEELLKKISAGSSGFRGDGQRIWSFVKAEESAGDTSVAKSLRNLEIEALRMLIKGSGGKHLEEVVNLGEKYFRFNDTRNLYLVARKKIESLAREGGKINFPLEISSQEIRSICDLLFRERGTIRKEKRKEVEKEAGRKVERGIPEETGEEKRKEVEKEIEEIDKLYNSIVFSEAIYKDEEAVLREILNNLKLVFISDEIANLRKRMLEIESKRKRLELERGVDMDVEDMDVDRDVERDVDRDVEKHRLEKEYDELYKKLIELENEKLKLKNQS